MNKKEAMKERTGTVFNIQHFCIQDGPGIRTGVFLKGCPLRCLWCANPESQSGQVQTFVNGEVCGERMTAQAVTEQVAEDAVFYGADGGVTLSGGEVLAQADFAEAVLYLAREGGIGTAVETSGCGPWEDLRRIAQYCDTVLYDVKHTDAERHTRCTGVGNERILANLRRLSAELPKTQIWIRVPLIPGYNDDPENLLATGRLAAALPAVRRVELLPYHNLGEGKRAQLGDSHTFAAEIPSAEQMEACRALVRESVGAAGIQVC